MIEFTGNSGSHQDLPAQIRAVYDLRDRVAHMMQVAPVDATDTSMELVGIRRGSLQVQAFTEAERNAAAEHVALVQTRLSSLLVTLRGHNHLRLEKATPDGDEPSSA